MVDGAAFREYDWHVMGAGLPFEMASSPALMWMVSRSSESPCSAVGAAQTLSSEISAQALEPLDPDASFSAALSISVKFSTCVTG